jgi:hypothetical protein
MDRSFTALRIVGTVFKVLAWVWLVLGLLAAVAALAGGFFLGSQLDAVSLDVGGPLAGLAMFIVAVIASIINFLLLYAAGEFVFLILSIEENTRRSAYIAQQQYIASQPAYASPPTQAEYPGYPE